MKDQLSRTLRDQGDRVLTGWPQFDTYVRLRPKSLVNVFSPPGVGKSMWAINLVHRIPVSSLYITLDTPLSTQAMRAWSFLGGARLDEVEKHPEIWMRRYQRLRKGEGAPWIEWSDVPMNVDEFPDLIKAMVEFLGEAPRIVVVDVIGDILSERSYEGFNHGFHVMKRVAYQAHATVITLHHAQKKNSPDEEVSLNDVEYAGDKQPDVVIGMHRPSRRTLVAAILKNRLGKSHPGGQISVRYRVNFNRTLVEEWRDSE